MNEIMDERDDITKQRLTDVSATTVKRFLQLRFRRRAEGKRGGKEILYTSQGHGRKVPFRKRVAGEDPVLDDRREELWRSSSLLPLLELRRMRHAFRVINKTFPRWAAATYLCYSSESRHQKDWDFHLSYVSSISIFILWRNFCQTAVKQTITWIYHFIFIRGNFINIILLMRFVEKKYNRCCIVFLISTTEKY